MASVNVVPLLYGRRFFQIGYLFMNSFSLLPLVINLASWDVSASLVTAGWLMLDFGIMVALISFVTLGQHIVKLLSSHQGDDDDLALVVRRLTFFNRALWTIGFGLFPIYGAVALWPWLRARVGYIYPTWFATVPWILVCIAYTLKQTIRSIEEKAPSHPYRSTKHIQQTAQV